MRLGGKRERDLASGLNLPPRLNIRSFLQFTLKAGWSLPALSGRKFEFVNVAHRAPSIAGKSIPPHVYAGQQFDSTVTWKDVERLAAKWNGPLIGRAYLYGLAAGSGGGRIARIGEDLSPILRPDDRNSNMEISLFVKINRKSLQSDYSCARI